MIREKRQQAWYAAVTLCICYSLWMMLTVTSCARYPTVPSLEGLDRGGSSVSRQPIVVPQPPAATAQQPQSPRDYVVGHHDILEIQVWDHPDLQRQVVVSQEGNFSYPLIGQVRAESKTVAQLEREISSRLAKGYIVNPQVTVTVKDYRSQKVFVLGEVVHRGSYPLSAQTTLLEVLSRAGGPTGDAGETVTIVHATGKTGVQKPASPGEASGKGVVHVDLQRLLEGDLSQNVALRDGDTIYVSKARYYYVFGQVKKPGKYVYTRGTTILKAITTAGGVTDIAAVNRTKIVREKEGVRIKLKATMSDWVFPEDIIMVPESFF